LSPTSCPKCGFSLPEPTDSCPKCGVILSKAGAPARIRAVEVTVTTGDLHDPYDILGSVYTQVSNKGLGGSQLDDLARRYGIASGDAQPDAISTLAHIFVGELPAGQQHFRRAFAVCLEDLRRQTARLGGDAIVWLRQDLNLDTNAFQFFYMQAYGTAVRRHR
jgi:uncharacterized protein YbjQ (UPF0145 family)